MQFFSNFTAPFKGAGPGTQLKCPTCKRPIHIVSDVTEILCEECWGHWCPIHAQKNLAVWIGPCEFIEEQCPICDPIIDEGDTVWDVES